MKLSPDVDLPPLFSLSYTNQPSEATTKAYYENIIRQMNYT
jgi:hypothetical protein